MQVKSVLFQGWTEGVTMQCTWAAHHLRTRDRNMMIDSQPPLGAAVCSATYSSAPPLLLWTPWGTTGKQLH